MLAFSFFGSELTHVVSLYFENVKNGSSCHAGYIFQSSSVATEIYNIRWYDAPLAIQRKVLLISVRSQRIVGVTAFKFYYVTIEQFGKVMHHDKAFCSNYLPLYSC